MRFLNDKEREVLRAFCDTIHPRVAQDAGSPNSPFSRSVSDLGVMGLIEKALSEKDEHSKDRLRLLLKALQRRVVNGMLAGHWAPFTQLSTDQRTDVLLALANSPFNELRGAFQGVKQLVSFIAYASDETESGNNPFWQAFNYQGHATCVPPTDTRLPITTIDRSQTLTCDVLVIGSGAGGAVVAAELAAAGQDVIIAEKGKYYANNELPNTELKGMRDLYEQRGGLRTSDRGIVILAGSTLGGGTTVNWMTCLRPPEQLLRQWAADHGFIAATSKEFANSVDYISQRIHVTTGESIANAQNGAIERGCQALGYHVSVIPRNVKECVKCDFCSFGCRYGSKQDTRGTFLQDAVANQARILVRAHVDRVTHSGGEATGAALTVIDPAGHERIVHVKCKRVVVAAGSVHTPAILMRSGLSNPNIGGNLFLHPVGAVFAKYAEAVNAWEGAPQTRICDHFADLDGDGYGVRMEASPAHPGLWALGLPWQGGRNFSKLTEQLPYLANTIVLTRDKFGGRVDIDAKGKPVLHYKLHSYDANHLMTGLEQAMRIHRAAGAELVYGPHNDCLSFDCKSNGDFEAYVEQVKACGTRPNHLGLFCAHQMSSCRIGDSAKIGAINPEGESYEIKNLFVADGSVLPTSTGVNPMVTILATAHHIAQQIKSRL